MKKPIPVGKEDFKEIINNNNYYVDKTGLIKELIDYDENIVLFTRPRRFGKTLNQSMLRYFFEKTDEDNSKLFDGLEISGYDGKYMQYQGKYPVISVTFKRMKQINFKNAYDAYKSLITNEFKYFRSLLESNKLPEDDKSKIRYFINEDEENLTRIDYSYALTFLSGCLAKVYNNKVIVLIDEYDVPLENAYFHNFYAEMLDLIRSCFEDLLKTNINLKMAVLTGCLRISKESIFTGMNNLDIYSVTDEPFSKYFGFTVDEVKAMLKYYQQKDLYDTIKNWYDGYLFGTAEIYNPLSVSKAVKSAVLSTQFIPQSYWANTSSNEIIRDLISRANDETRDDLENLLNNKILEKPIYFDLTYGDLKDVNSEQIWSHLLFTGYLKQKYNPDTGNYILQIPNKEVMEEYKKILIQEFKNKVSSTSRDDLLKSLIYKDVEKAELIINDWLYNTISYYDESESFYHGTMLGLLSGFVGYKLESNKESGKGRFDLVLYDAKRRTVGILFEFKIAKSLKNADAKMTEALNQLKEKDYSQFFSNLEINNVIKYAVVFRDKRCKIEIEE